MLIGWQERGFAYAGAELLQGCVSLPICVAIFFQSTITELSYCHGPVRSVTVMSFGIGRDVTVRQVVRFFAEKDRLFRGITVTGSSHFSISWSQSRQSAVLSH